MSRERRLQVCPKVELCLVADGSGEGGRIVGLEQATAAMPASPVPDESIGAPMLYTSGTTGRPKGVFRLLPEQPPGKLLPVPAFLKGLYRYREGMIYLSPAPLYHAAPLGAVNLTIRTGGTAIIMERFDPETYLELIQKYRATHSQLVPTMFARMLRLPDAMRLSYDLSSLEVAYHAAAPCPVPVKEAMIEWWGPIIHEYYGATEGHGFTACTSEDGLPIRGRSGRSCLATSIFSTMRFKPVLPASPARSGSSRLRPSSISTTQKKRSKAVRRTAP